MICKSCHYRGSSGARFIMEVYNSTRNATFGKKRYQKIYKPCKKFSNSGFVTCGMNDKYCKYKQTEEEYIENKGW